MALFAINRFHGEDDEEKVSEENAKALLERLHEKAKARQLEKLRASDAGKRMPVPQKEESVKNLTSPLKSDTRKVTRTPSSSKKKSKGTGEGEVPLSENESDILTGSQTSKMLKKEKRKRRNAEQDVEAELTNMEESEHEEENDLEKKIKRKRTKSESGTKNQDDTIKEKEKHERRNSKSKLPNEDGIVNTTLEKSETSKKSKLEIQKEKRKSKKRNREGDELRRDNGEQSDEGQSDEDEENGNQDLDAGEETTSERDLEASSHVLIKVKKTRRKSESEMRNKDKTIKGEKKNETIKGEEKSERKKSKSKLANHDGPVNKKGAKSENRKKSKLGDKVGEVRKEKKKLKKMNRTSELEDRDELKKDDGGQSDEEQSDEDEEHGNKDLDAGEESTSKTDLEASSLVLGGFEKKAVEKVQRVLPYWLSHPSHVQKGIKQHLVPIQEVPGIHPKLLKKLQANEIHSFFPVQAEVIPAILESTRHGFLVGRGGYRPRDICVSAPTGSGKTLAFVIPVIQALLDRVACHVRALVVLPTKELAQQVCKVFSIYADGTQLKIVSVTGQKSFAREQETLVEKTFMGFRSMADIVVATAGRLVDHIDQTPGFSLKELRFLIIDEADRMIDSLSQDWLNRVTKAVYRHEEGDDPNSIFSRKEPGPITAASTCFPQMPLQKLLFSATLTKNPEKLQQLGLYLPRLFTSVHDKDPGTADTEEDSERNYILPEGLTHYYVPCNLNSKPLILFHFLVTLKFTRVLCFTNSKEASHRLFLLVQAFGGLRAAEFSSRLSASERQKTLKQFEQGKIQILISTDATARGIDIKGVTCVINYDAPQFMRVYIHRVGRTARAGKSGLAFTLLLNVQQHQFLRMVKDAGTSELQKQFVKSENLTPLLERYEEALVELQRTVSGERVKRRA